MHSNWACCHHGMSRHQLRVEETTPRYAVYTRHNTSILVSPSPSDVTERGARKTKDGKGTGVVQGIIGFFPWRSSLPPSLCPGFWPIYLCICNVQRSWEVFSYVCSCEYVYRDSPSAFGVVVRITTRYRRFRMMRDVIQRSGRGRLFEHFNEYSDSMRNFLSSWSTIIFSRKILLHGRILIYNAIYCSTTA
jgi:hypothetical protein